MTLSELIEKLQDLATDVGLNLEEPNAEGSVDPEIMVCVQPRYPMLCNILGVCSDDDVDRSSEEDDEDEDDELEEGEMKRVYIAVDGNTEYARGGIHEAAV